MEYYKKFYNDIIIIYKNVNNVNKDFVGNLILNLDSNNRVINVGNNLGKFFRVNICMEIYIMKCEDFVECIYNIVNKGNYCYLEEFIIEEVENMKIGVYEYIGYLKCVNFVELYFEMSKDLLNLEVVDELLYFERKIFIKEKNELFIIYIDSVKVENSFIVFGCLIEGIVKDSIIFRKVNVEKGIVIENLIVM